MSVENPYLQNLPREHGFEDLRVSGKLPEDLQGTLYRAGTGLFERFGRRVAHPFEADGAVSAVRLSGGTAKGAARVVRSDAFHEEESKGRFLYNSEARWLDRVRAALTGRSKATGNTSIFHHQGKLYALMEAALAHEIDPDTLESKGLDDFGVVKTSFSAHPRRVASRKTTFNFSVRYEKQMLIDLHAFPDEGAPRKLTTVSAPWMGMVHDFVATENYLVLLVMPARLKLLRAMLGLGDIEKLFAWQPEMGSELILVPLAEPDKVRRTQLDAFWVWHFVNAFEAKGKLHVDACRYERFLLGDIGDSDAAEEDPTLQRLSVDLETLGHEWQSIGEHHVEFPSVHPSKSGAEHSQFFSIVRSGGTLGIGSTTATGKLEAWLPEADQELSEPVAVPRSEREGDAWILDLVLDRKSGQSHLAVLDGQRLAEGPVARAHFDHAIPMSFHGAFVGAA